MHTDITTTHLSYSRVTSPAALFMTTLDDMAPEEQVVHNVIPLKDKMPRLGFSDVHCKAKHSLTVTFVSQTLCILMSNFLLQDWWRHRCHSLQLWEGSRQREGVYSYLCWDFRSCESSSGKYSLQCRAVAPRTHKSCLVFAENWPQIRFTIYTWCFLKAYTNIFLH